MNYKDSVLQFLAREENIPIVVEVVELFDDLRAMLHVQFWHAYAEALRDTLARSAYAAQWEVHLMPDDALTKEWAKSSLRPMSVHQGQYCLRIVLSQDISRNQYQLYYGVMWTRLPEDGAALPDSVQALSKELSVEHFTTYNPWWLGHKYLDVKPGSAEFVLRMGTDKEGLVQDLVDLVWGFFEAKRIPIESANRALAVP